MTLPIGSTAITDAINPTYQARVTAGGALVVSASSPSGNATIASIPSSATSTPFLAANSSRLGMLAFNNSASMLYLAYGASASPTSFTVRVPPYTLYEMDTLFTGVINACWDTATGNGLSTELF